LTKLPLQRLLELDSLEAVFPFDAALKLDGVDLAFGDGADLVFADTANDTDLAFNDAVDFAFDTSDSVDISFDLDSDAVDSCRAEDSSTVPPSV
jgi:hypothetical protein